MSESEKKRTVYIDDHTESLDLAQFIGDDEIAKLVIPKSVKVLCLTQEIEDHVAKPWWSFINYDILAPISLQEQLEEILRNLVVSGENPDFILTTTTKYYGRFSLPEETWTSRITYYDDGDNPVSYTIEEYYTSHAHYPEGFVKGVGYDEYCIVDLTKQNGVRYVPSIKNGFLRGQSINRMSMVLKRVRAGMYQVGHECWNTDDEPHIVTISNDYYIGLSPISGTQWNAVRHQVPHSSVFSRWRVLKGVSYETIRGAGKGHEWPWTNRVDDDSFIAELRKLTGIPNIDIPTEAEWAIASETFRNDEFITQEETMIELCLDRSGLIDGLPLKDPVGPMFGDSHVGRYHKYSGAEEFDYFRTSVPQSFKQQYGLDLGFRIAFMVSGSNS